MSRILSLREASIANEFRQREARKTFPYGKRYLGTAFGPRLQEKNGGSSLQIEQLRVLLRDAIAGKGELAEIIRADITAGARTIQTPTFRKPHDTLPISSKSILEAFRSLGIPLDDFFVALDFGTLGDCYTPEEAPKTVFDATVDHRENIGAAKHVIQHGYGNEILWFETINSITEAVGIAIASLLQKEVPLTISFVVDDEGRLLDGTPISEAVAEIRQAVRKRTAPIFIGVNCCSSKGRDRAKKELDRSGDHLSISYINASDQCGAIHDGSDEIINLSPHEIAEITRRGGIHVNGACCGGTHEHIQAITRV